MTARLNRRYRPSVEPLEDRYLLSGLAGFRRGPVRTPFGLQSQIPRGQRQAGIVFVPRGLDAGRGLPAGFNFGPGRVDAGLPGTVLSPFGVGRGRSG